MDPLFTPEQYRFFDPLISNGPSNLDKVTKVLCPITKRDLGPSEDINDVMSSELDDVSGVWYNHINGEDNHLVPIISDGDESISVSEGTCVIRNTFITINESVEIPLNDQNSYFDSHDYLLSSSQHDEGDELIINGGVEGTYTLPLGHSFFAIAPGWDFDNISLVTYSVAIGSPVYEGLQSWGITFNTVLGDIYAGPSQYVGPLNSGELYKLTYALNIGGTGHGPIVVSVTDDVLEGTWDQPENRMILNTHTENTESFVVYTKYFLAPSDFVANTLRFECTEHIRSYGIDSIHLQKVSSANYWYHAVIRHNPDVDRNGALFGLLKATGNIDFDWSIYCILGTFKVSATDSTSGDITLYIESNDDLYTDIYTPPYDSPSFEYRKVIHMPRIERTLRYDEEFPNSGKVPYVSIVNPTGNEMYLDGDEMNIYWNSRGLEETDKIRIDLFSLGEHVKTVATDLEAFSVGHTWVIDSTDESIDFCSLRLSISGEMRLSSTTNPVMAINPEMEITAPEDGDEWLLDSTEYITFSSMAMNSRYVNIDLYKGETYLDTIKENLICYIGEYEWHISDAYFQEDELITNSGVEGTYTEEYSNIYVPPSWHFKDIGATVESYEVTDPDNYEGIKSFETKFTGLPLDHSGPYQYIGTLDIGDWYKLSYTFKRIFGTIEVSITNALSTNRLLLNTHDDDLLEWITHDIYFRAIGAPDFDTLRFESKISTAGANYVIDDIHLQKIFIGSDFKIRLTETTRPDFYVESDEFEIAAPPGP